MEYMEKCFKKSQNIVDRLIDDEIIIVPVSSKLSSQGTIYNLDPVGAKIWQWIDGKNTVAKIKQYIVETMDVSCEQAEKDLIEFLKDLESVGAIEEAKER
jgi:hypothetical protein